MRQIHFLLLCCLSLLALGCLDNEEENREPMFFSGETPIRQNGTCTNLVSHVKLYQTRSDGVVLGIDGGSGRYTLTQAGGDVVKASFIDSENGYRRIRLTPLDAGRTTVEVRDGKGRKVSLNVNVDSYYRQNFGVADVEYLSSMDLKPALWSKIKTELSEKMTVKKNFRYELIPEDQAEGIVFSKGELRVYSSPLVNGFTPGTYECTEEGEYMTCRFQYDDEVHLFMTKPIGMPASRAYSTIIPMYEDVTDLVTDPLPEGCRIYKRERWNGNLFH